MSMSMSLIRPLLYDPNTPWKLSPVPASQQIAFKEGAFSISVVSPSTPEFPWVNKLFQDQSPSNREIGKIYRIINQELADLFEANLPILEREAFITPSLKDESHAKLRQSYLRKWEEMTSPLSPFTLTKGDQTRTYRHAKLMFLWHGTNKENFIPIANFGLKIFGRHNHVQTGKAASKTTDLGFFGDGIYLIDNPEVSSDYGNCLVLTLVAMKTPFPIVGDMNCNYPNEPPEVSRFKGLGRYENYSSHFAPVKKVAEGIYYPCSDLSEAIADEFVIFDPSLALPLFWIELIVALIRNPVENPRTVQDLITCLKKYQHGKNEKIFTLLQIYIDKFEQIERSAKLTDSALQVYEWAIRFFEGKEPPISSGISERRRSLSRAASAPT